MVIIKLAVLMVGWFYVFWLLFVMCAGLYFAWPRLSLPVKVLASPPALFSGVFDVVSNYTVAVLLFLQWPPSGCYTFTRRLSHYLYADSVPIWRKIIAGIFCNDFLNPFQQGGHCRKK